MTIDEALKEIEDLKKYIKMLEEYQPVNFEQEAIKLYVELESVTKAAVELNNKGYKVNGRKVISKDVSDLIRAKKANDDLQELAKKMFSRNKKRSSGRGW